MQSMLTIQCDGERPVCRRCAGYGYKCEWGDRPRHGKAYNRLVVSEIFTRGAKSPDLIDAIKSSYQLLVRVRERLPEADQKAIDLSLSILPHEVLGDELPARAANLSPTDSLLPSTDTDRSPTSSYYHGEASDIRFFTSIKEALHTSDPNHDIQDLINDESITSYEQNHVTQQRLTRVGDRLLPGKSAAESYIDIYLSTIHLAYPFIEHRALLHHHAQFWVSDSLDTIPKRVVVYHM